ncbi:MAG: tRNA G18 (ribose-2'-O)-methylase SpoU [Bacteroidia bacterium]|jgi:23S rRNA (guanosine2251-2'-O)-methyltransferase
MKGRKLQMDELGRQSVDDFKKSDKLSIVVVLDDIRSLHNIGSVFRTADAFAIKKIILCGITARPPHREIQKTALGATESVEWEYAESCLCAIDELRTNNYRISGVEQVDGSVELDKFQLENSSQQIALVFGNEVKGVSQAVLDACDDFIEIPQNGTKHSLNVSVSVGVVLWELVKKFSA